jgi:cytochrome c oxidase subunit 1
LSQIIFFFNFFYSLFWGPKSGRNPWHSNTLEWSTPSPAPHGNFDFDPVVYRGPYEYAEPNRTDDYHPQWEAPQPGDSVRPAHSH